MDRHPITVMMMEEADLFLQSLSLKVQRKITFNIDKVRCGFRDIEIFKKLDDTEIWEFRTKFNGMAYRLFAFWDIENQALIVCTHGIVKKTRKTPPGEIAKAERIRRDYFNND